MTGWDPQDDFTSVVDGLEAVTLCDRQGVETAVTSALRRHVSERDVAESNGQLTRRDAVWHLPAGQVPEAPEIGVTITDGAGQSWTVLRVDQDARSSRWRCWSRRLPLAGQLSDRVELQRAVWSKDAHGGLRASWQTVKTNIAARVQAVKGQRTNEEDRRVLETVHQIYTSERLSLDEDHRIVRRPGGEVFRVLGFDAPEQLAELMAVRAVRVWEA